MSITRLASKEIFSPSNKIYREVGRAKGPKKGWKEEVERDLQVWE